MKYLLIQNEKLTVVHCVYELLCTMITMITNTLTGGCGSWTQS